MIHLLREMAKAGRALSEIIAAAIEKSRYLDYLREDMETYPERKANIDELVSKAAEWEMEAHHPDLVSFLEELTLKSAAIIDKEKESAVRLMTLHNGKGLEFRLVFLVGMEEDLLPHINVKESDDSIEEERRLCYVGITRAKEHLFLTAARQRMLWGTMRTMRPSRFLNEIPSEYLQVMRSTTPTFSHTTEEDGSVFNNGQAVFHKDFGAGVVQKSYNTSLGLTYDVFFPKSHTMRTLVAKYANLARLD
jgi:DNA helicase-2/ATP-dependent DNA helicase PcrA